MKNKIVVQMDFIIMFFQSVAIDNTGGGEAVIIYLNCSEVEWDMFAQI